MTMIKRVARAIAQSDEQNSGPPYEYRIKNKHSKAHLFDEAKAAIAAMREPTPDMILFAQSNASVVSLEDRWRMMIDAALKEE